MPTDDHWVKTQIIKARAQHTQVTEAVSSRMVELLKGQLGERQLSKIDLASLAKALIADMVSVPPKMEATR